MIVFIVLLVISLYAISKSSKPSVKRCYLAPPGESKVHHWVLKSTPDSKVLVLQCRVCGQVPGED